MPKAKKKFNMTLKNNGEIIIIGNLGTRIRQWRKEKNMKGYIFAKVIKISQGSLSEIENNKTFPSVNTVAKIHRYTGADINWIIFGDVKNK